MENIVTLFANGMGDFQLVYYVTREGTEITIPVRTANLPNAINLSVFGADKDDEIIIQQPGSFQATNANRSTLQINPDDLFGSLWNKIAGARIKVKRADKSEYGGKLVGVDTQENDHGTYKVEQRIVTILGDRGNYNRIPLSDITEYEVSDKKAQEEIGKALASLYAKITPDSSLVTMRLASKGDKGRAVIGFTIPVAAWTMEYQLRQFGDVFRLTGNAIVHNPTDQSWENCRIRVVTGIPYAIRTDIAEQIMPDLPQVNIVNRRAAGGTEVSRGKGARPSPAPRMMAMSSGLDATDQSEPSALFESQTLMGGGAAASAGATAAEVADYTVLSPNQPVTIPSNSSSIIEVVDTDLQECKQLLYYNYAQDAEQTHRPQMALEFTNPLPHSLGRGPCNVYLSDGRLSIFGGTSILSNTKPGEKRFLLHGQDTGVTVYREGGDVDSRFTRIEAQRGVIKTTQERRTAVTYRVVSVKPQIFNMVIDHVKVLNDDRTVLESDAEEVEAIPGGSRYALTVPARAQTELKVTEVYIEHQQITFDVNGLRWFRDNIIDTEHPALKSSRSLAGALEAAARLESKEQEIAEADRKSQSLNAHQQEVRQNLQVSGTGGAYVDKWRSKLAENDDELNDIRSKILPRLRKERDELQAQLRKELGKAVVTWTTDDQHE